MIKSKIYLFLSLLLNIKDSYTTNLTHFTNVFFFKNQNEAQAYRRKGPAAAIEDEHKHGTHYSELFCKIYCCH